MTLNDFKINYGSLQSDSTSATSSDVIDGVSLLVEKLRINVYCFNFSALYKIYRLGFETNVNTFFLMFIEM